MSSPSQNPSSQNLASQNLASRNQNLRVTGRVWVFGDGLTTDDMYPPDAMKLDLPEAAKQVFHQVRPGWTSQVRPGDVVVAGRTFGLGSSRPVAALFRQLGVAALIAEEFNSLFFRNAVNAGLPAMTVPDATSVFHDGDLAAIDLAAASWANQTTQVSGTVPVLPGLVLEIIADGGVLPRLARQGYLPAGLAEVLRSPAVAAAAQGGGA
jgi:3-isopropylmalate/(R)-2-methylmalate dehydratase small subunit